MCIQDSPVRNPLYNLSVFKFGYASAQIIPRPIAQRIADGFAWWTLRNVPEVKKVLRGNLGIATGKTGEELEELVRENVRTFSRMLADRNFPSVTYTVVSDTGTPRA